METTNIDEWSYKICPILYEIKKVFYEISISGIKVHFIWVKAHIGLVHNEYVDILAKQSITTGLELSYNLGASELFTIQKHAIKEKWEKAWEDFCKSSSTRYTLLHPNIPLKLWHEHFSASRKFITTIIRLKFGHACYAAHLYKIGVIQSDLCEECDCVEDLDHIFFACIKYRNSSDKLIESLINLCKINPPFSMIHLLALNCKKIIELIMVFLHETQLKL